MKSSIETTKLTRTLLLSILAITSAVFVTTATLPRTAAWDDGSGGGGTITPTPATFNNYELATNPFNTPNFSVGTTCPNTSRTCQSAAGEPAIRADKSGNFYGSTENTYCVIGGLCGGTFAVKSTDGGAHFLTLPLPNSVSSGPLPPGCTNACNGPGLSAAGGDTDIAVAPVKNSNGFYNIYVASLQSKPPLLNVYVSTSKDGGATWSINPTGASIPVDDREWIAADGANKVCLSYHATLTTNDIIVDCSTNAGLTFTQHASAFEPTKAPFLATLNNQIGNLASDPRNHVIYQGFSAVRDLADSLACLNACHTHTVWVGVSIDGGSTFTDYIVYDGPTTVDYGHSFVNISVDTAGNVYAVYSDDQNLYYSYSTTFGQTWSGRTQINKRPSNTAIFPWGTALGNGGLDVVWYGTDYCCAGTAFGGGSGPTYYPSTSVWYVYFSQNLQATTPGSIFTQVKATGVVHYGDVCELGANCMSPMNRDLIDDFGVAASPTTGNAAIIYTNDQLVNSTAEPATRRNSGSYVCATNNNVSCSHTDIAIQTGGSTLNQKKHHFETDEEDFEETDLRGDGGHAPEFNMHGTNTGTSPITSITAQISGLPLTLSWNTEFPLQPGQDATATTTTLPLGLVLAVGSIYTITITATMADGTTETQTTSAVYTLGAGLGL